MANWAGVFNPPGKRAQSPPLYGHKPQQMSQIFKEDADVRARPRANEALVQICLEGQPLNVRIAADADKALAAAIADIPEALHGAENQKT